MDTTTSNTATSALSSTELLTLTEAAAQLGVSKYTVRRYIKDNLLNALRDERLGMDFVRQSDVDNFQRPTNRFNIQRQTPPEGYVSAAEFAEKFGVTTATVHRWRHVGIIPASEWVRSTEGFVHEKSAAIFYSKKFMDTFTPDRSWQFARTSVGNRVDLPKSPKGFINVREFAALAKVKEPTAAHWMALGRLAPVVVDGVVLVKMDDAAEFIRNK